MTIDFELSKYTKRQAGIDFIREFPAERWLRNGRGFTTFDGLAMV